MEEEFESTLKLLKTQKQNLIKQLEIQESLEEKNKYLKIIKNIDDDIYNTYIKINDIKKINANKDNQKENKLKKKIIQNDEEKQLKILAKKENKKTKQKNITSFILKDKEIKEIIDNHNYISIKHLDEKRQITTIYKYKNKCKNNIYYICKERNSCIGRGKIDKKKFSLSHFFAVEMLLIIS